MKQLTKNKMKWKIPEIPYQEQILFFCVFSLVIYGAFTTTDSTSLNIKRGLVAIVLVLIGEAMLKPYDILFLRPNMAFWRGVLKCVQLYYYILIFLAFQKREDGRSFFKYIDPSLGVPVPESMHTYADHCGTLLTECNSLINNKIQNERILQIISIIITSFIGLILYVCSSSTEINSFVGFGAYLQKQQFVAHTSTFCRMLVGSYSFRYYPEQYAWNYFRFITIPFFHKLIQGYYLLKWLKIEDFDLFGKKEKQRIGDWGIWKCHRRFGLFLSLNATYLVAFAGGFFVWNGLWVPPNIIWVTRIIIWLMTATLSNQEIYYDNITWNTPKRREAPISGKMRWNACSLIVAELVIIVKYWKDAGNMTDNPTPMYIWLPWSIVFVMSIGFYLYLRFKKDRTTIYGPSKIEEDKTKKE